MNKNEKKQMLIEAFDVLKDSWDSKKDAIDKLMSNMFKLDQDLTIDMWIYLLEHNQDIFNSGSDPWRLTDGMIYHIDQSSNIDLLNRILDSDILIDYLYRRNNYLTQGTGERIGQMLVYCDLTKVEIIIDILKTKEKYLDDSLGEIIMSMTDEIKRETSNRQFSEAARELLLSLISSIKDKEERATATIAYLDLDD